MGSTSETTGRDPIAEALKAAVRDPGIVKPEIQAAMLTVPEFAALDEETQVDVVDSIAELIDDATGGEEDS